MRFILPAKLYGNLESLVLRKQENTWGFIQQYMDISRPVPDIPALEPFRRFDPTTSEHDEATGRDPYFWRNMSNQEMFEYRKKPETDSLTGCAKW